MNGKEQSRTDKQNTLHFYTYHFFLSVSFSLCLSLSFQSSSFLSRSCTLCLPLYLNLCSFPSSLLSVTFYITLSVSIPLSCQLWLFSLSHSLLSALIFSFPLTVSFYFSLSFILFFHSLLLSQPLLYPSFLPLFTLYYIPIFFYAFFMLPSIFLSLSFFFSSFLYLSIFLSHLFSFSLSTFVPLSLPSLITLSFLSLSFLIALSFPPSSFSLYSLLLCPSISSFFSLFSLTLSLPHLLSHFPFFL